MKGGDPVSLTKESSFDESACSCSSTLAVPISIFHYLNEFLLIFFHISTMDHIARIKCLFDESDASKCLSRPFQAWFFMWIFIFFSFPFLLLMTFQAFTSANSHYFLHRPLSDFDYAGVFLSCFYFFCYLRFFFSHFCCSPLLGLTKQAFHFPPFFTIFLGYK